MKTIGFIGGMSWGKHCIVLSDSKQNYKRAAWRVPFGESAFIQCGFR